MSEAAFSIRSPRLHLRRLQSADLEKFLEIRADPEVARYQGWDTMTAEQAHAFICEYSSCALFIPGVWCQIGIADESTNQLLGDIGVCLSADSAALEFGISLASNAQGKGYAREAMACLVAWAWSLPSMQYIHATADARNAGCIRLLEQLGMARQSSTSTTFKGVPCVEHLFRLSRPR